MKRIGLVVAPFAAATACWSIPTLAPAAAQIVDSSRRAPASRTENAALVNPAPDATRVARHYNPWDSYIYEPWYAPVYAAGAAYYPYSFRPGRRDLRFSFGVGRATERYRQNVLELRQKYLKRLCDRRGTGGTANEPIVEYAQQPGAPPHSPYPYDGYQYVSPLGELHDQGRELERYRQEELFLREQLTLLSYSDLFDYGLEMFRAGRYGQAARLFVAAADANHEDAASRIHAAQSLLAVGQYDEALAHVRRAFELAPPLLNMPLDLAADYNDAGDYRAHIDALDSYVAANPKDYDAAVLLAVARFFSPRPADAAEAMARIKPLAKTDPFVCNLLAAAAPVIPEAR